MLLPKNEGGDFELPPAGTHMATCYRVVDLGTQDAEWQGQKKRQHKILIGWELSDEKMSDGRPFSMQQRYTLSSSERSRLRQDLESWRGQPFSEADYGTFRIEKVIGIGCLLGVVHNTKPDGKTFANISAVMKLPKGTKSLPLINPGLYFSLEPAEFNQGTFDMLSDGLKAVIQKSPEYQAIIHGHQVADEPPMHDGNGRADDLNDMIPF